MTGIDQIIGQQNALEILRRVSETGRVPHGLLFQGPEGCGKASVATAFAARLIGECPGAGDRVDRMFYLATGRPPGPGDRDRVIGYIDKTIREIGGNTAGRTNPAAAGGGEDAVAAAADPPGADPELRAWTLACQALISSSRFQYLD